MNNISTISTKKAPQAIGPYSQGVTAAGFLFVSGQLPLDPEIGRLVEENISIRAEQVFQNMAAIIDAAGASMSDVVKITLFLTDMNDFKAVNEVYSKHFKDPFPARSTVQVTALPLGSNIEAEAFVCIT
ncbi:RidA family protein [Desulfobacula sp.]|uniref:RidA family protein n=1 Tax=Desulfobacula sp. TaxID=2593537 RepID=UPI0026280526|nr:RidA family protein [Desulfobacula sp.]